MSLTRFNILDLADVIMGQSPPGKDCNEVGLGIPLLNGPTEFGNKYPKPVQFTTNPKKVAEPGDLLFCVRGSTVGRMNYANQKTAIGRGLASFRSKYGHNHTRLIEYLIYNSLDAILQSATGSTFPNVSKEQIHGWTWDLPPVELQNRIVEILGSLDDRIELNRRMNETLEQMAMALFNYWFMDGGIEQDIPIGNVEDFARIIGGGTPKTTVEEYWGGEIPWVSVKDLSNLFVYTTEKTITEKGLQESSTKLIPKRSTIISARGTIGELSVTGRPMTMNQSCYAFHSEKYPYFTYLSLKSSIDTLKQNSHGSVFNTITKETIQSLEIPFEPDVCFQFEEIVEPWFSQIDSNTREIVTLTETRDYLLPRLLSGEIEVKVVEEQVEEVLAGG